MFHSHTSPLLHVLDWIDYRGGWMGAGRTQIDGTIVGTVRGKRESPLFGKDLSEVVVNLRNS